MSKKTEYRQCKLKSGIQTRYAWIPSRYAILGKSLCIKDEGGWQVVEVYSALSEDEVKAHERRYLRWARGRGLNIKIIDKDAVSI